MRRLRICRSICLLTTFTIDDTKHVTLSGYADEMDAFLQAHPDFVKMRLPHPWHHPDYGRFADQLEAVSSAQIEEHRFVSGVTAGFETTLQNDHWQRWLVNPIDFIASVQALHERYQAHDLTYHRNRFPSHIGTVFQCTSPIKPMCHPCFAAKTMSAGFYSKEKTRSGGLD
jgi:hypothetical protein